MNQQKNGIQAFLEYKAYCMRLASLRMTTAAGSGHATSCLSAADLVTALFLYAMRYDPQNFNNPDNDHFILSKGHASPLLYAAWNAVGQVSDKELMTYRQYDSVLEGHPTFRFPYTEAATGALGIGLSVGVGMVLAAKLDKRDYRTYVLLGDGEIAEGCVWEAAEIASHYKLNNLIGIVDCNRLGQSTESINAHHVQRYAEKFEAFGFKTFVIDGHNMQQIMATLDKARESSDLPVMILAKTFKGHGVDLFENKENFHGKALRGEVLNSSSPYGSAGLRPKDLKDELAVAEQQLAAHFKDSANYVADYVWEPNLPQSFGKPETHGCVGLEIKSSTYKLAELVATRKAYGVALRQLGTDCKSVVSLDADVKNSTYADIFEAKFPERFFQCFIAEQNMVSMGVGFERRGKIPFISTFAAFFSRAYDQIRMAAIGNANLRLVGSHAGVSIGQDGPSQMALEDIAIMRALPGSIVLYPCDAVSTNALVGAMVEYNQGISYLRTTRMETPVIYDNNEEFLIGGCKVLRQSNNDVACIVAAGVTLHEALKAYDLLQQEGINIAVIDLYSVKPLDATTLTKIGQAAGKRIITVEDHYREGGIGEAVVYALRATGIAIDCLSVTALPRSGQPEELLAWAGIDAAAIIKTVRKK